MSFRSWSLAMLVGITSTSLAEVRKAMHRRSSVPLLCSPNHWQGEWPCPLYLAVSLSCLAPSDYGRRVLVKVMPEWTGGEWGTGLGVHWWRHRLWGVGAPLGVLALSSFLEGYYHTPLLQQTSSDFGWERLDHHCSDFHRTSHCSWADLDPVNNIVRVKKTLQITQRHAPFLIWSSRNMGLIYACIAKHLGIYMLCLY